MASNKAKNMSTAKGSAYQANRAYDRHKDQMRRTENAGYSGKTYDNEQYKNSSTYLRSVGVKKTPVEKSKQKTNKTATKK